MSEHTVTLTLTIPELLMVMGSCNKTIERYRLILFQDPPSPTARVEIEKQIGTAEGIVSVIRDTGLVKL